MRLAAKHREMWLRLDDCGVPEIARIPGRFGSVEMVRMGKGEPIVLLPGLAGGWRLLTPLARFLSRRFEVILMGLRGDQGPAAPCEDQRPADHALEIAQAIAHLRLERPAVLGVSYGGAVALEMAVGHPGAVGALALYGAEGRFRPTLGSSLLLRLLERLPLPSNSGFLNQFFNVVHGRRAEPGPLTDFIVERCWETDQGVVAGRLRGLEGFDVADRLWRIDVPTLVLGGTRDVCIPSARQKALADAIAGARFSAVEGAGHVGFLTHAAEVAAGVEDLVNHRQVSLC